MKNIYLLSFLLLVYSKSVSQDLLTSSNQSLESLVSAISLDFDCSSISNITSPNNADLHNQNFKSIGAYLFQNEPNFPFDFGIVLATKNVDSLKVENSANISGDFLWPGDPDIEELLLNTETTTNASVIEFDFVPFQTTLSVDYILASNEYTPDYNFICSFPDTFAFIVSGPGIPNSNFYNHDANPNTPDVEIDLGGLNIATINGTNIPVNPTNVHNQNICEPGTMGEYAIPSAFDAQNSNNNVAAFFGQTVPLTATVDLIPGQPYHIKLVIADASDSIFDSAIFIDATSFDIGFVPDDLPFNPEFSDFELPDCWVESDSANFNIVSNCSPVNENYLQLNGGNYSVDTAPVEADLYPAIEVSWEMLNGCNDIAEAGENLDVEFFDGSDWNPLDSFDPINLPTTFSNNTNNWTSVSYIFSEGLSKNFKIRFKRENGNNNEDDINIANFSINPTTNCPLPSNFQINNISETSVEIIWNQIDNYNGLYNYILVEENVNPESGPIISTGQITSYSSSINISQLQEDTLYDFYIFSTCDNTSSSFNFSTSTLNSSAFTFDDFFVLYPSPATDYLKLESNNSFEIIQIEIIDMNGKVVKDQSAVNINISEIDIKSLKTGLYFLKVFSSESTFIKRFIKN